jgi:N-acetylmuramoyl-L-alanine amidase
MQRFAMGMLALLAFCAVPLASARAVDIRNLKVSEQGDGTRVLLELSGSVRHKVTTLHNPERVVLDVPGAHLARGVRGTSGSGSVRQVRISARPRDVRLVIDLAQPAVAKSFLTKPGKHGGYLLVVALSAPVRPMASAPVVAADRPVHAAHARPEGRDLIIAIDAGHGGEDPGAIGKYGTREKDVVLAIARELMSRVNTETGMHAVLTRDGDYFVPLRDRMRRARARQADLFVSIHADSIADRSIDGSSVYILSPRGATSEAARWLAERENAADLIGGVSLDDKNNLLASVLLDVSQSAAMNASQIAAERVLRQLSQAGQIRKAQVQQAGFMVLKSPDIPSMLVETAYISNPAEELKLRSQQQQGRLAGAIQHGVHDYFYANPPAGSRVAQLASSSAPKELVATAATAGGAGN